MWKDQKFSVTQISREINFGESISSKFAIFAIFRALNFVSLVKDLRLLLSLTLGGHTSMLWPNRNRYRHIILMVYRPHMDLQHI